MNEKSFKFKESFYTAINSLNEKQAGRLVKGICEYAFNGKEFTSKDATQVKKSLLTRKRRRLCAKQMR